VRCAFSPSNVWQWHYVHGSRARSRDTFLIVNRKLIFFAALSVEMSVRNVQKRHKWALDFSRCVSRRIAVFMFERFVFCIVCCQLNLSVYGLIESAELS